MLSVDEAHEFLASEEWRKKDYTPFENYDDFLKAVQELQEDEYMVDMHVDDLLIFHPKNKHYWANHNYTREKYFMLQDKVCMNEKICEKNTENIFNFRAPAWLRSY